MFNSKDILERLKTLRVSKDLRQDYLASRLGIDRTTYVRKERGIIPITTDEWLKLADAMEEEPAYFFTVKATKALVDRGDPRERREAVLVRLFRALNREEREDLVCCLHLMLKGIRRKMVQDALERLRKI